MHRKKIIAIIFAFFLTATIFIVKGKVFSDNAGTPFSNKSTASIGAWYDETWQATGFYRLARQGATDNFIYSYTADNPPITNQSTTFISTPPVGSPPAAIQQDMVVTEWKVTGHVHFSSGM